MIVQALSSIQMRRCLIPILVSVLFFSCNQKSQNQESTEEAETEVMEEPEVTAVEGVTAPDFSHPLEFAQAFVDLRKESSNAETSFSLSYQNEKAGIQIVNFNEERSGPKPQKSYSVVFGDTEHRIQEIGDAWDDVTNYFKNLNGFRGSLYSGKFSDTGLDLDNNGINELILDNASNFNTSYEGTAYLMMLTKPGEVTYMEGKFVASSSFEGGICDDVLGRLSEIKVDKSNPGAPEFIVHTVLGEGHGGEGPCDGYRKIESTKHYKWNQSDQKFMLTKHEYAYDSVKLDLTAKQPKYTLTNISKDEYTKAIDLTFSKALNDILSPLSNDLIVPVPNEMALQFTLNSGEKVNITGELPSQNDEDDEKRIINLLGSFGNNIVASTGSGYLIMNNETGDQAETRGFIQSSKVLSNSKYAVCISHEVYAPGGSIDIVSLDGIPTVTSIYDFVPRTDDGSGIELKMVDDNTLLYHYRNETETGASSEGYKKMVIKAP